MSTIWYRHCARCSALFPLISTSISSGSTRSVSQIVGTVARLGTSTVARPSPATVTDEIGTLRSWTRLPVPTITRSLTRRTTAGRIGVCERWRIRPTGTSGNRAVRRLSFLDRPHGCARERLRWLHQPGICRRWASSSSSMTVAKPTSRRLTTSGAPHRTDRLARPGFRRFGYVATPRRRPHGSGAGRVPRGADPTRKLVPIYRRVSRGGVRSFSQKVRNGHAWRTPTSAMNCPRRASTLSAMSGVAGQRTLHGPQR